MMWRKIAMAATALFAVLLVLAAAGYGYLHTVGLFDVPQPNQSAVPADIAYLDQRVPEKRGRILAIVTSTSKLGSTGKRTGYELTELSRAYYVFVVNGYDVDIASPLGGEPPVRIDKDDMQDIDYAFLNDPDAQKKVRESIPLARIDSSKYDAVYFGGGKGAMFDFPDNADIHRIVNDLDARGVVGAVCHGPAALLNARRKNGDLLIANKKLTGFSNTEELFLMENARGVFPFLLEDKANSGGAQFIAGPDYLDNTVVDGRLVTGQNAWSTWSVAEAMVRALGHLPVPRDRTSEEWSVKILNAYYSDGFSSARELQAGASHFDKMLLAMHALVATMQWRLVDAVQILRLMDAP